MLTKETPLELLSYAECDESYPTTSTIDQFFHTAQFKAYRDLGRHNGREIVRAREALSAATSSEATYLAFSRAAQAERRTGRRVPGQTRADRGRVRADS